MVRVASAKVRPVASIAEPVQPFLRWPGGKRWLVPVIRHMVADLGLPGYIEPFLGGGAVFFGLCPKKACLADVNEDLINTYRQVREAPDRIAALLRKLPVTNASYQEIRSRQPRTALHRAVRFLYLNRTGFMGLYRVNRDGNFNVPFGGGERTAQLLYDTPILRDAASALQAADLRSSDFEVSMSRAGDGDLVYCDPTYTVVHNMNGFQRYNEAIFSWSDQVRLSAAAAAAAERGALVIVSNADHPTVTGLYPHTIRFVFERVSRVSPRIEARKRITEALYVLAPRWAKDRIALPPSRETSTLRAGELH
jgi:DNA adenine methylase